MPFTNLQTSQPTPKSGSSDTPRVRRPWQDQLATILPISLSLGIHIVDVFAHQIPSRLPVPQLDIQLSSIALFVLGAFESAQAQTGRTTPLAAFFARLFRKRDAGRSKQPQALPRLSLSPSEMYLYPIKRLIAATVLLTILLGGTLYILNDASNWDAWNRDESTSEFQAEAEYTANAAAARTVAPSEKQQAAKAVQAAKAALAKSRIPAAGNTTCEPDETH